MRFLLPVDCAGIWHGVTDVLDWRAVTAVAVALSEGWNPAEPDKWDTQAVGNVTHLEAHDAYTIDLGGWQLSSWWHIDNEPYPGMGRITFSDTFDAITATERAWAVMTRPGTRPDDHHLNLAPWTAYRTGAYEARMGVALAAVNEVRAEQGLGALS